MKTLPLAREEWDFTSIPDIEVDACFWWEYCRASPAARAAVEGIGERGDRFKAACGSRAADILTPGVLMALSYAGPMFPRDPWVRARSSPLYHAGGKGRASSELVPPSFGEWFVSMIAAETSRPVWSAAGVIGCRSSAVKEDPVWGHAVTLPILGGSTGTRGATRTSMLTTIDWRFSNEQIAEALRELVKRSRPGAFPAPRRAVVVTPSGAIETSSRRKALSWLSVWRRKQACSWSEFEELYWKEYRRMDGAVPDNFIDVRKQDFRKAVRLLKRFGE